MAVKKHNRRNWLLAILSILVAVFLIYFSTQVITRSQLNRSDASNQNVSRGQTTTGSNTNSSSVVATDVSANSSTLYIASVSTKPNVDVTSVSGLGLDWKKAGAQCGGRNQTNVNVWYAYGSPTASGSVTAQLAKNSLGSVISVTQYQGANAANPVSGVVTENSNGVGSSQCEGGKDTKDYSLDIQAPNNSTIFAVSSIRHYRHEQGSGFSEISEVKTSRGGGDDAGLAVMDRKVSSGGSINVSGSTSSDVDYATLALVINPAEGSTIPNPTSTSASGTTRPSASAVATVRPTSAPTVRPTSAPTLRPSNAPTTVPTVKPTATSAATPVPTTAPPVGGGGEFPCGKFPNANPGCMNVSYQSWFDNVPASAQTMTVNYTPRLVHQHYDCALPVARANGQYLRQGMKVACQLVRYNSIVPYLNSNSGRYDSGNQGNIYESYSLSLPACQTSKYLGFECKNELTHNVRPSDMSSNTEMRFRPNANFVGMDGTRHFVSANWQTGIGYRSSSELTTRYWQGLCGGYQRVIVKQVDKFFKGNESIPTVSGTITVPFTTNGGCGDQFKTFVFLDPSQHTREAGTQSGTTLMETNSHFNGNLTWDTTKTTNGIHNVLFINYEGTGEYVSAAGVAVRFNVQN